MIFRKPYAFLIKNFRKIHIVLLLISLYCAYQLFDVSRFVSDFMQYGTYDIFQNPISKHITWLLRLSTLLLAAGSAALLILLRYKKKPWKVYLIPIIEYLVLFFVLGMVSSFFNAYSNTVETTDLRLSRDLLMIFIIAQLPAIGIFIMRILNLDIKKFNFNSDEEFLQLSEQDREEFEVNFNFDINSVKRFSRRAFRNIRYFYIEHKLICNTLVILLVVFTSFQIYRSIFITHKSYSEGDDYMINGYTFQVHNSYYTDKDYSGTVISKKSNFVVVDLDVVNHAARRSLRIDNFHLKNGVEDYTTTRKTYATEFQDLGETYDSVKELQQNEKFHFIIVFKVDKDLKYNRFQLYYQEKDYLRKIKLNVKDVSEIQDEKVITIGDSMNFSLRGKKESISIDDYEFLDSVDYLSRICGVVNCFTEPQVFTAPSDQKVLKIEFSSILFEGKDMVDFSNEYGKIIYIDNSNEDNEEVELNFKYPFSKVATGKYLYTLVPRELEESSSLKLVYVVRNKKYVYQLV